MKKFRAVFLSFLCLLCAPPSYAESEVEALRREVAELRQMVSELKNDVSSAKTSPPAVISSASTPARWTPEIGVIADVVAKLDSPKVDEEGADRVSVRELELVLGSAVDPYSRLDATIAFSDFEEASLEEAYYTHFELPWDLTARVGRFKPRVGKAIPMHRDSLETVDEPLAIEKYFGVEGYNKTGADLKKILDLPWSSTHEVSLGILEGGVGEGGTVFGSTRRHPTIYSHLKNYWDVTDSAGFELGASHLVGSKDSDAHFEVNVLGIDATWIQRLNPVQTFKLQGESFFMNREETLWGAYFLADWRFHTLWSAGGRLDYADADKGISGYLTFHQSEFARWRLQLTHREIANGKDDDQVLIQGAFAIGDHKHKIQ
ncbi:MAG: hypothetical protein HY592_02440 [Candidatus Omnitrophica bacterium]|nr:hypothetical protein [Candidatus Omnitrophota bacterium]